MDLRSPVKHILRICGHALVTTIHDRLDAIDRALQEILDQNTHIAGTQTALLQSSLHLTAEIQQIEARIAEQVCVETSDYLSTNPELGLLAHLYSCLPSRTVLDIGAHIGDVSDHLLKAGYEVYAFEPYPQSHSRLQERLGDRPDFHSFNLALGNVNGELPLNLVNDASADGQYDDPTVFHSLAPHGMPADLTFNGAVPVPVRRLSELHEEGVIPADAGFVKIDTEGYDLEVIRGMGDRRYPAVMVEFWDTNIPFATSGLLYTLDTMVGEMRQRGYLWHIVIYRVWGKNQTAFFCNHDRAVPGSWGNILFFQQREIFVEAQHWCSAVLPRTYFKHVAANPDDLSGRP
jgi:FkbM family methyltransferase